MLKLRRRLGPLLLAVLGLLLQSCQTAELRNARIQRFVEEMIFGGPNDRDPAREPRLLRWERPVRVYYLDNPLPQQVALFQEQLAVFSELTAVPVLSAASAAEANLTVAFKRNPDFLINREYVPCYVGVRSNERELILAEIEISVADPDRIKPCVAHELMHSFGFGYHSAIVRSIMSPLHGEETLTEWDELALRLLYDPSLQGGMTREDARPVMKGLIVTLQEAS